ncbi:hypothetical protein [Sedimentitalea sp.]|uniref:hypothetical protein n=1 Tax=Sedimentitalea sp. TaxID=2048915 RepID=UPI00329774DE
MDFEFDPNGADLDAPLIYLWVLHWPDGRQKRYVGKAQGGARRPRRHYARNVRNLLAGRPYRKNKPDQFRAVHRAMADCIQTGGTMVLRILENVALADLLAREQYHIRAQNADLNG